MAVTVTAALVGSLDPQIVQVAVAGLTSGNSYEVTGRLGAWTWPVRGGTGVVSGTQVVLNDASAPINAAVVYEVLVNETTTYTSAPITVPWNPVGGVGNRRYLISSLDGSTVAGIRWQDNNDPRELQMRSYLHPVAGRDRPVAVYDIVAGETNTVVVDTDGDDTEILRDLIRAGAPVMVRTDGGVRDLTPVEFAQVMSAQRPLLTGTRRRWTLGVAYIDDPEPDTLVAASTWDDFDLVYASSTWNAFDAEWTGQTWNDFDREDWDSRA